KVLAVEGAVERVGGGWRSTGQPWTYDEQRYARVQQAREHEQDAMRAYQRGETCRMQFLQHVLDDDTAAPCGRCDVCAGAWYPTDVPDDARSLAAGQLSRAGVELPARAMWPTGMERLGVPVKGRIAAAEQVESGRALARLTDLGWGQRLRELLAEHSPDGPVPAELVRAAVGVLAGWGWAQRPVAVAWVPSRRRPQLVASFAGELARLGRLVDLGPLQLAHGGPIGQAGGNSAFRLAGVWERLVVGEEMRRALAELTGPVLLVDDFADSRWTIAVAGRALRRAGSSAVLPFTLAVAA
ncbi:MAG TPA: RecQ family zinc-binding domain-containing protein, partial [Actinomycetales bacterium]|nr:RecQ family zinc-binding domain-containing protein [Actinomycetales bacterium]